MPNRLRNTRVISCGASSIGRDRRVEIAFQGDVEVRILGAGAVIGEVERLLDQRVEVDLAALAAAAARMLQHALDDAVGAPAVLGDLFEIAGQHPDDFVDIGAFVFSQPGDGRRRGLLQLVEQFDREPGEIVDEVERVLDLVGDAGGQLAERGHLLGLDQPVLGAAQISECRLGGGVRPARFLAARGEFLEQPRVLDREHGLPGKGLQQGRRWSARSRPVRRRITSPPTTLSSRSSGTARTA